MLLYKKYPSSELNIFEKGFLGGSQKAFFLWLVSAAANRVFPLPPKACAGLFCLTDESHALTEPCLPILRAGIKS